jgi:crotonobetainyl-CoA:carnitine CoA-transferase CaiB-like acyl-CoA transferase
MKLQGLRVLDFSLFLPGPYLTLALADHGAEVIKVEPPGAGDPGREIGLSDGPSTVFFRNLNRGKKSIVVNLKDLAQREALLRLCETADVLVESFRPGVAERLGIGYATVRARNPRIVYCSISAFGQDGPYRERPAHDLAVEALSGVLSITEGRDGKPAIPGIAGADYLSGLQGLAGVLMALLRREKTGRGDRVDITMHDSVLCATLNVLGPTLAENRQPVTKHERTTGGAAFYQIYDTRDGRQLVLGGQEKHFIENLLNDLGRPDLIAPCLRGPGPHQRPVIDFLAGVFARKTLAECVAWLGTLDVCFGPVNTLPEALADPGLAARGMILHDEAGRRHIAPPIHFQDEPARPSLREPKLGEHTEQLLGSAGAAVAGPARRKSDR